MFAEYGEQITSDVADIKNIGEGRWGGAITAAKFLEHFVADRPWVHVDVAGPAFAEKPKAWLDAGGTGFLLRTLVPLAPQSRLIRGRRTARTRPHRVRGGVGAIGPRSSRPGELGCRSIETSRPGESAMYCALSDLCSGRRHDLHSAVRAGGGGGRGGRPGSSATMFPTTCRTTCRTISPATRATCGHAHGHGSTWMFGVISFRTVVAALTFFGLAGLASLSGRDQCVR